MKKVLFISMIVALVISSIIGITIVLADEWIWMEEGERP